MELAHVYKMMENIKPGDKVFFNSVGACDTAAQAGRSTGATIPATGTVLKVYPCYVLVRLKVARECVRWDSIVKLNGISWPLYNEVRTI